MLGGSSGGQQSMAYSYTETTVTVEQTSMIIMSGDELDAFLETGSADQPLGGFFDLLG